MDVLAHQVVAHDDDGDAGRAHVLLCAAPDEAVAAYVHGARQEARRHVAHQGHIARLGKLCLVPLDAANGFVLADVDVAGLSAGNKARAVGDVRERSILARGKRAGRAVELGFVEGFLAPGAGEHVIGGACAHEVHRHAGKLRGAAALHKENLVVVGHAEQRSKGRLGRVDDLLERRTSMAHLHHRQPGTVPVEHLGCSGGKNLLRKCRRACVEV